ATHCTAAPMLLPGNRLKATMNNRYSGSHPLPPSDQTGPYPPWGGGYDPDEVARSANMLIAVLVSCAAQRHQTFSDLANSLGVSYGYLAQLRSGLRPIEKASSYFIASAAKYLWIPRASALMLAELPLD